MAGTAPAMSCAADCSDIAAALGVVTAARGTVGFSMTLFSAALVTLAEASRGCGAIFATLCSARCMLKIVAAAVTAATAHTMAAKPNIEPSRRPVLVGSAGGSAQGAATT